MKKRTIKQQVKYAEEQILDRNEDFYDKIIAENFPKKAKISRKHLFAGISTALTAIATILIVTFLLWPSTDPTNPTEPSKHYLLENERYISSNISELNSSIQGFFVEIDDDFEAIILEYYDNVYNDDLYYSVSLFNQETHQQIIIKIFINSLYENLPILAGEVNNSIINGFNIDYIKRTTPDEFLPIYSVKYEAMIKYNTFTIYILHEQPSINEDSNFTEFFEQTFKKLP